MWMFSKKKKEKKKRLEGKKKKKSDRDRVRSISKRCPWKSFVFADSHLCDVNLLDLYRGKCDLCMLPLERGPERRAIGRPVTYVNADKIVDLRYLAELALDLYNDKMVFRSFKLKKVCKINHGVGGFYWLTFRAREHGGEEYLFRGVVHVVGGRRALFCEIKEDDKITLLPWDDDYVSSEQACESKEDCPLAYAKNDHRDGSAADSGDGSITGSDI